MARRPPSRPRFRATTIAAIALSACTIATGLAEDRPAGDFDFYVLALSWSPSYCTAHGADANATQCEDIRPPGFVVHGLWPQYENGWPQFCANAEQGHVPQALVDRMIDIMPSGGLIGHQWRKHGTCSGLSQADYFAATRRAHERIEMPSRFESLPQDVDVVPEKVEAAFAAANPGLAKDGMAVTCEAGLLRELRICLDRDLGFRSCREVDARSCTSREIGLPAADP